MIFSIIIINFNTAQLTLNCVNSLYSLPNLDDIEIIVVDNGSLKSDLEILGNKLDKRVKLIKSRNNLGFSAGNNLGAKQANGKYLLFLNSDTIIRKNIFSNIEKIFLENSNIGIISPRLINQDGSMQSKAYGPFPSIKYLLYKNLLSRRNNYFPNKVDWVSGAALFIKRDVFNKIGGWDENFFLYLEDVDLCWRVKNIEYKVILDNFSSVVHLQGMSLKRNNRSREYYYKSQKYLFKKHRGLFSVIILLLIRLPLILLIKLKR